MANITKDRNTTVGEISTVVERSANGGIATFYKGGVIVNLTDRGVAVPVPSTMSSSIALGVFVGMGSGSVPPFTLTADGQDRVAYKAGAFWLDNSSSTDEVTAKDIGKICYLVDDHTVAKTSSAGTRCPAGRVIDVNSGSIGQTRHGVLVHIDAAVTPFSGSGGFA